MTIPTADQVRTLPAYFEQAVPEAFIDVNGHMNIHHYFELGTWAPWKRAAELGIDDGYIERERQSFFTVEHHVRYLAELRLGDRFSVRPAFTGRTTKAMQGISFVLDETHDRVACVLEVLYVYVSTDERRSLAIPDGIAAALDAEIAQRAWAADLATGIELRR